MNQDERAANHKEFIPSQVAQLQLPGEETVIIIDVALTILVHRQLLTWNEIHLTVADTYAADHKSV
jgi:hypothetical protein